MTATEIKPFYKLRGMEYSTDFDFFLREQIFLTNPTLYTYQFSSRLDGMFFERLFTKVQEYQVRFINNMVVDYRPLTNAEVREECKRIHEKLLAGEYGQGQLID